MGAPTRRNRLFILLTSIEIGLYYHYFTIALKPNDVSFRVKANGEVSLQSNFGLFNNIWNLFLCVKFFDEFFVNN